jgi:nucleotide-binding universal stress UspA family protein
MSPKPIRTILVTTDLSATSQKAFGLARQLAGAFGAKILAVHVHQLEMPAFAVEYSGLALADLERRHEEDSRRRLEELAHQLGENVETVIVPGVPHLEIVRLAKERAADLIVMATHGGGFFSHAILGSTTERVLRRAPCPVLAVRAPAAAAEPAEEETT